MITHEADTLTRIQKGDRIEKGDLVVEIDMQTTNLDNIVRLLRGSDRVGSVVKILVEKGGAESIGQRILFELQRADMRGILKLKNLYIALAGNCIFAHASTCALNRVSQS
jgi:hypothetical protein